MARVGSLYFTDNGAMVDLDAVVAATWGNRDNDVVFVRVKGDTSEFGLMLSPGGGAFLAALREWRGRATEGDGDADATDLW